MDPSKVFGVFPDGYRMSYKALLETLVSSESPCNEKSLGDSIAMRRLVAEHGGDPKMYFSEGGIES